MTCTHCGASMQQDARFCPRCGTQTAAAQQAAAGQGPGLYPPQAWQPRVHRHIESLVALWGIYAAYRLLIGLVGLTFFHSWTRHTHGFHFGRWTGDFWGDLWPAAWASLMVSIALAATAAYGLRTRQTWGRVLAIVAAVIALIHPLLGTALGAYTLWVLAPAASGFEYDAMLQPFPQR